jgi:hypothetical protein
MQVPWSFTPPQPTQLTAGPAGCTSAPSTVRIPGASCTHTLLEEGKGGSLANTTRRRRLPWEEESGRCVMPCIEKSVNQARPTKVCPSQSWLHRLPPPHPTPPEVGRLWGGPLLLRQSSKSQGSLESTICHMPCALSTILPNCRGRTYILRLSVT